ncbi:MAG: aminotransferase [Eubacterium sp.]|nr:aminotransferase [Eubacterium sp.]
MNAYKKMDDVQLREELKSLKEEYKKLCESGLDLDMSRGKPGLDQIAISMELFDVFTSDSEVVSENGFDCRNYGLLDGPPEAKRMMASIMNTTEDHVIVYGNSSLNVMYDQVSEFYSHGVNGMTPWCKLDKVKWLCPVPGYDRHFAITEHFGIEMINIPMNEDGPDMDAIERFVEKDPSIKGVWCVPMYSNPEGASYSDEVVRRFANLKPAAKDFRIFWDNAYAVHHLYDEPEKQDKILDILEECEKAGNPDMAIEFASTSKITFPGSGIAALASSINNVNHIREALKIQTIGHDKINMLRHVKLFKDHEGIKEHMSRHAALLRDKFNAVLDVFDEELAPCEIATWTKPRGGYFISLHVENNCAKKIVKMCKDAGMVLTGAGATFPYHIDPYDSVIRIAPSYPTPEELTKASHVLAVCTKIATIEKEGIKA